MKKISLIPIYTNLEKNKIFDNSNVRDNILEPMENLKFFFENKKISLNTNDINTIESSDAFLFYRIELNMILKLLICNNLKKAIYLPLEPEIVDRFHSNYCLKLISKIFGKTLTWNDSVIDNKRIFKCYWVVPYQSQKSNIKFSNKNFLVNISGNKISKKKNELYSERLNTIRYFENNYPEELDLYGTGWNKSINSSYIGEVKNKHDILKEYKYTLCYENMKDVDGYITEKIFDCFYANTIPVYWGCNNIKDYIPQECFIDRSLFVNDESLREYLIKITEDEYNLKINAINNYLQSEQFKLFLSENYSQTIFNNLITLDNIHYSKTEAVRSIFILFILKSYMLFRNIISRIYNI
jgi:hypothetical protein